jgi:hypothetical protein
VSGSSNRNKLELAWELVLLTAVRLLHTAAACASVASGDATLLCAALCCVTIPPKLLINALMLFFQPSDGHASPASSLLFSLSALQQYTGEMGVLAIIPLVAFFGFGVLSKDDFNGFLWNVVMLAMGGLALGEAVQSSGLLATISNVSAARQPGKQLVLQVCVCR